MPEIKPRCDITLACELASSTILVNLPAVMLPSVPFSEMFGANAGSVVLRFPPSSTVPSALIADEGTAPDGRPKNT